MKIKMNYKEKYWLLLFSIANFAVIAYRFTTSSLPIIDNLDTSQYYFNTNIVSRWCDLLFFTYWGLLLVSFYFFIYSLSLILKKEKPLLSNKYLRLFLLLYEVMIAILYTLSELTSDNINFGLYNNSPSAYYCLFENLYVHYFVTIFSIIFLYKKIKNDCFDYKKAKFFLIIPFFYYLIVYLSCLFFVPIKWSPYPIFSIKSFLYFFGINNNLKLVFVILGDLFLLITLLILVYLFCVLIMCLFNKKKKKYN